MLDKQEMLRLVKKYGIFSALMLALVTVLLVVVLLSRTSWTQGLSQTLQETLNRSYPDTYSVGNALPNNAPFSVSSAVFTLTLKNASASSQLHQYGIIVRIPTISGPAPAVFLYSPENGVTFVDYALDYGKAASIFENDIGLKIIQYWQTQVYAILRASGVEATHD